MKKTTILLAIALVLSISLVAYIGYAQTCPVGNTDGQKVHFATQLTSAQKRALWITHIETYRDNHDLTSEQQDVIRAALKFLENENLYEEASAENFEESDLASQVAIFKIAVLAVFTQQDAFDAFEYMPEYTDALDENDPLMQRPFCNCARWWGCSLENSGLSCLSGCTFCGCNQIIDCGPFWGFTCDGKCSGQLPN